MGALTTSPSGSSPAVAPAGSKLPTTPSPVQQVQTPGWAHSRQGVGGDADASVSWP